MEKVDKFDINYFMQQSLGTKYDTIIIFISEIIHEELSDAGTIVLPVNMNICISGIIICILSLV